jgi:hypothetical protein
MSARNLLGTCMEPAWNLHGTYTEPAWVPPGAGLSHRSTEPQSCTALGDLPKRKPPIPGRCRRTPPLRHSTRGRCIPWPDGGRVVRCACARARAARPHDTRRWCGRARTAADAHTVSKMYMIVDPFKFKLDYLNLKYLIGCESFRFTTWRDVSEISCCVTKA